MGMLRVKCLACGQSWEVYRHNKQYGAARTCPHCGERIDAKTWEENVLVAYDMMQEANLELMQDHVNYHKPIFQVEYWEDSLFPGYENEQILEQIADLSEQVQALEKAVKGRKS